MNGRTLGVVAGTALLGVGAGAAALLLRRSDDSVPQEWRDDVASFVYTAKTPEGGERMFSVEGRVLARDTFHRVGASYADAVQAAHEAAAKPLGDGIHDTGINPAQGVFQAQDGAYWIAPLGGDHRGKQSELFIDGAFWDAHGIDVQVQPHTSDLKAVVGATKTLDLRDITR